VIEGGGTIVQETRLYDPERDETRPMRSKEEANDYRYFPDPDLLPVELDVAFIVDAVADLPELPDSMRERFHTQYGLGEYDASLLTVGRELAQYFEAVVQAAAEPKLAANWVNGELAAALNRSEIEIAQSPVSAAMLAGLIHRIQDGTVSGKLAKQVFEAMWSGEGDADSVIQARGLRQITDSGELEALIAAIVAANPGQVEQYRAGKDKVFGFFVGRVMKDSKGKANPQQVNEILMRALASD
jgi:aspartyl-tRNA(Asn)/glutamyl-tRNA(Gln) amidotransferase subunit B